MHEGPKKGERWSIGTYDNLVFIGFGRDFIQDKYFIFEDQDATHSCLFVISKDEFFSADLKKVRNECKH